MIANHGGPFSDATIAAGIWRKHHAMISFESLFQVPQLQNDMIMARRAERRAESDLAEPFDSSHRQCAAPNQAVSAESARMRNRMKLTVDLMLEEEALLAERARAQGESVNAFVYRVLRKPQRVPLKPRSAQSSSSQIGPDV